MSVHMSASQNCFTRNIAKGIPSETRCNDKHEKGNKGGNVKVRWEVGAEAVEAVRLRACSTRHCASCQSRALPVHASQELSGFPVGPARLSPRPNSLACEQSLHTSRVYAESPRSSLSPRRCRSRVWKLLHGLRRALHVGWRSARIRLSSASRLARRPPRA